MLALLLSQGATLKSITLQLRRQEFSSFAVMIVLTMKTCDVIDTIQGFSLCFLKQPTMFYRLDLWECALTYPGLEESNRQLCDVGAMILIF